MLLIIFIIIFGLALWIFFKFFKLPKLKNVLFVDGAPGTGKTLTCVYFAIRKYHRNLRNFRIKKFVLSFLSKIFKKSEKLKNKLSKLEEPLLYSNIKLRNINHVILKSDLLKRQNFRFAKGSVLLLDEYSLIADQFLYKDRELNERMSEFWKLIRHEIGSKSFVVVNSQSTSDVHFSLKYVLSDYIYIHSRKKLPFVSFMRIRETTYNADTATSVVTTSTGDIEKDLMKLLVFNRYYKYYDSECYSIFTDCLPVYKKVTYNDKNSSLKADLLVSFKELPYLYENIRKEKIQDEVQEK